jgi:hypothetical protein
MVFEKANVTYLMNCFKSTLPKFAKGRSKGNCAQNYVRQKYLFIKLFILFALVFCLFQPVNVLSLTPFFFDTQAFSVDQDGDGGDDYILVKFDIDIDEEITANVTVNATLLNESDSTVDTETAMYPITAQQQGYNELKLTPSPNIEGIYSIHLSITDSFDEVDIFDISYSPESGSQPIAYFADAVIYSEMDSIQMDIDVNIVQKITIGVKVDVRVTDSSGNIVDSEILNYDTLCDDMDYKHLTFIPPAEDIYTVTMMAFPAGSGSATDSKLLNVIYPPGTGAYFKTYDAVITGNSVKVNYDVDLEYNVKYPISIEAIMYNSCNDPVAYLYTSFMTKGTDNDGKSITLIPDQAKGDNYYVELVAYIEDYPSSYGYINDIIIGNHIINATSNNFGTITPSGTLTVNHEANQQYTFQPSDGYCVSDVKVDGQSLGRMDSYTFNNVCDNHTIEAFFTLKIYTITVKSGDGGTITPSGVVTVNHGSNQVFTITPLDGYHISELKVDGESKTTVNTYTFDDIKSNHTIEATFYTESYTITAKSGDGGKIEPSGTVTVNYGTSQEFTITPSDGYHITDVKVDGESKGAITSYPFTDVKANHTIEAIFAINTYTITAKTGEGGKIEPSGTVTINYGTSQEFTITPSDGYHITDVKVDGESKGAITSYPFTDVKTNHTIEAIFAINTYTITVTSGEGGKIEPSGTVTINYGTSQEFTITPSDGYRITDVKVDGESKGAVASYSFTDVKANHNIDVSFAVTQIKGDVDGDGIVRSKDAFMVISYLVQLITLTDSQKLAADIDNNGNINSKDALLIMRKSIGLISAPPKSHSNLISLMLPEIHGVAGESIIVPVRLDKLNDVICGIISISYDSRILKAVDVTTDQDALLVSNINQSGIVYIAFIANDNLNGKILSFVKFNIISDDVSPIRFVNTELYHEDTELLIPVKTDGFFSSWAKPAEKNVLFQNFPNPFNPGTWIPYQLKSESEVTITIYSEKGELVNELKLGHKPAGVYTTNSRSAYWDGRNKSGEKVASGVYFYNIKAGKFTATRKMMILE